MATAVAEPIWALCYGAPAFPAWVLMVQEKVTPWPMPSPLSAFLFPVGGGIKVTDCMRDDHVSASEEPATETGHDSQFKGKTVPGLSHQRAWL